MTSIATQRDAGDGRAAENVAVLPRKRRNAELLMLAFSVGIVAFGYAEVGFQLKGRVPPGMAEYVGAFAVIVLAGHVAVRWLAPYADPLMLPLAATLNGLGIVMIYRLAQIGRNGNPGQLSVPMGSAAEVKQIAYTALGVACFVAVLALVREPRKLRRYTYTFGVVGIVLIALPALLPASISAVPGTGTKVQIALPGLGSVQPEEFAKLALAVAFAGYLVTKRDALALTGRRVLGVDLPRIRDLGPIVLVWVVSLLLLIFESDIGTSAVFLGLFVVMLYLATQRTSWLLIGAALFVLGAFVADKTISHIALRFDIWLHPFAGNNPTNNAYQLVQGLYGLGYGGLLGRGLGGGQPWHTPLVQSDMIITAFGEELGLAGLMVILLLFGLLVQRGLKASLATREPFAKVLAAGLAFMLAMQVFVIVGGVTRLIPLAGIPTPFLSQGGSSLVATWMLVAVLARVSDSARRPPPMPVQEEGMTQVVSVP